MDGSAALMGAGMVIGGIVWLIRLEGRQNVLESKFSDVKDDLSEIKDDVKRLIAKTWDRS